MELNELYDKTKERMNKTIKSLRSEYDSIRAGRASAKVLDKINADYYGTPTPIVQMASVSNADARTLVIQPWDKSALSLIVKAIQASDLGINPQNDGTVIRLNFPALTEERRKQLAKDVSKTSEEAKIAIRQIRRDSIDKVKAMKKSSEITEDDQKAAEGEIQDITDDFIKQIGEIEKEKTAEIMEI
ncbi:MAG: ribosome recycling factor [Clostridiales bacterium]|nr:ribosome recycling factor [Clostridiales bacterium]MCD7827566.1 ribosome recycling factor [Clostridiales bacterium]